MVHRYELLPDTGGAGLHRGGHAIGLDFEIMKPESIVTARGLERMSFQPWGLTGGKAGALGHIVLNPDGDSREVPKISVLTPNQGDIVSIRSPGGGGWGNPLDRSPERVVQEVADGLLSVGQAAEQYGVVVAELVEDESGQLFTWDTLATEELRAERQRRIAGIVQPLWQFGTAREAYEGRFTPEASDALALLLLELPPSLRWHRKQEVHKQLANHEGPITPQEIQEAWSQTK
jgi:N-methylhydantoinase B